MKRTIFITYSILFISISLLAQKNESVTVKAGTRVIDYFPAAERYLYPNFTEGKITLKDGRTNTCRFNLNFLSGEMEFIQSKDTLIIAVKKDLYTIVIAKDTFYYENKFMQLIRSGKLRVFINQRIGMKDILKKGAMGSINRTSASDSYGYMDNGKQTYNLKIDEDMVFQKNTEYYFSFSGETILQFNRKNITKILPRKEETIKDFLKSNMINFESKEDLFRLAAFVSNLASEKSH
jgi:hypothetical protein